ncbi:hypothetical protein SAMN05443247_07622 [Bradyrhizobium erythrophlei]|nr:hypothetical protein SAMN05443247_07622 [Bradyrhizobium erythrophlei]
MIELFPIPTPLVGKISPEVWRDTSEVVQTEIVRAWRELSAGIAIQKDRRCGRRRRAPADSFYALHLLDMEIWRRPDKGDLIAKAEQLRELLAPDEALLNAPDDLADFREMAKLSGKTLDAVLREYIAIEQLLRAGQIKGFELLAKKVGIDLKAWAADVLWPDEPEAVA